MYCMCVTYSSAQYLKTVELRRRVLRIPIGLDFTEEELAMEDGCLHLAAFEGADIVGCLILQPSENGLMKMRQVAVEPECQGEGIGTNLVIYAERIARDRGCNLMKLAARETAVSFYLKQGYSVVSEKFVEVTLPHFMMEKRLL